MSRSALRLLFLICSMTGGAALAAPPATLGYQGNLANAAGQPITGDLSITFRLFDVASGGSALWTEFQPAVEVDGGNLSVELGSVTPLPTTIWGRQLYLGVQIAGDSEMLPRPALTATPYALRAAGTMRRTIVVSAEGTPAQNGAALLAAVAGITDASAASPVAVEIDAGTFDLGAARLAPPQHTTLVGRGQDVTVIDSTNEATTILLTSNSGARRLTARNTSVLSDPQASSSAIAARDLGAIFTVLDRITLDSVTGHSLGAPGSTGGRNAIVVCAGNSLLKDIVAAAEGGQFAMGLRADCPGTSNLVVDGATLYAGGAAEGIRGAYLTGGPGNQWRRLRVALDTTPTAQTIYGLRFFTPGAFYTELAGTLGDSSISIRGANVGAPSGALRLDGIAVEDSAQLASIERVSVRMANVRGQFVIGVRLLEGTNNVGRTVQLDDVDIRISALQDSALGYGEVIGLRAERLPPTLNGVRIGVDCLAGGSYPCLGVAQPFAWAPVPGALVLQDCSIRVGHAGPTSPAAPSHAAGVQVAGPTRILHSSLRVTRSAVAESVNAIQHVAATAVTELVDSTAVATDAAGTNSLCVLAGPGGSGEWFGNHVQGARCDAGAINLTCAGNTRRGTGFLAGACP